MNFLPVYGVPIPPSGNGLVIIFMSIIAYAIVRHRLMEIEVVIRKSLVYSILIALISATYLAMLVLAERVLQGIVGYRSAVGSVLAAFIIALGFIPVHNAVQRWVDRLFFGGSHAALAQENERLRQELTQAERLKSVGTLAAGLAHEIKNPLTSVLTFSRHVARRFDDPHFRVRFQRVVPRELERINGILERFLELARPTPATFTRIRLAGLVDRAVDLFANDIESHQVEVTRDYARDLPPVAADEESLYRAVINVVSNALDAMPGGGRLGLRVGWTSSLEGFRPARPTSRQVVIEVNDTGTGIRPEDADRLFNPFFTTKQRGTGLGLAVSHKIVEDHGGVIDFHSVAGVGTTFRIVLPLTPPVVGDGELRR